MGMNLLCDIIFCLRVMVLDIFLCLQKLLHFLQKYKQKAIKLLRQISFAVGELCICLSKILNQVKICSRFVHFSNPHYIFTLKNLFTLFSENKNNLRLCLNNLKNWFRKTTNYAGAFVPNVHMSYFLFVLYYNSSNHSSIHYF